MKERREYASMGFMYEFQKKNNPPQKRVILSDKIKFFDAYKEFLGRSWMNPLLGSVKDIAAFIAGKEKIVLKGSTGGGGKNVKILRIAGNTPEKILQLAQELHF